MRQKISTNQWRLYSEVRKESLCKAYFINLTWKITYNPCSSWKSVGISLWFIIEGRHTLYNFTYHCLLTLTFHINPEINFSFVLMPLKTRITSKVIWLSNSFSPPFSYSHFSVILNSWALHSSEKPIFKIFS